MRDPQIDKTWILDDLVEVFTQVDCGALSTEFFYEDTSPFDTLRFSDTRAATNSFQVLYTDSLTDVGVYEITYRVSFDDYPGLTLTQEFPFTVTIIDPCDEPVSVTPSVLTDQEYTIIETELDYIVPPYTVDPSWCAISYSYTVTAIDGDSALSFDDVTPKFTFDYQTDTALSGPIFTDYTVSVIGTAGIVTPVSSSANFNLRIKNPCIDPSFVSITESPALATQSYVLFDLDPDGLQWTESPFTLNPVPLATNLCGPFEYIATFNSVDINDASVPLSFDSTVSQFSLYSEDFNLINGSPHTYSMKASLVNYPDVESLEVFGSIEISDPCPSPNSVTASSSQTNPAPYFYTGLVSQVEFNVAPFQVEPSVCPFNYQCQLLSGPTTALDLCNFDDSAGTKGSFNSLTGRYTF